MVLAGGIGAILVYQMVAAPSAIAPQRASKKRFRTQALEKIFIW